MKVNQFLWHSFIPELFRPDAVAIDLGANHLDFTRLLSRTHSHVYALEPNDDINRCLDLEPNISLRREAIYHESGYIRFNHDSRGDVFGSVANSTFYENATADSFPTITLAQLIEEIPEETIDFVKMDIEGAEIPVLLTAPETTLLSIRQLTVEFHDFLNKDDIPKIQECIQRLKSLGFVALKFFLTTFGDVLFLNTNQSNLGVINRLVTILRYKYIRGVYRLINTRIFGDKNPRGGYRPAL